MSLLDHTLRRGRSGLLLACVLGALSLSVCPAHAALRRVAVDAGARTRALVAYLEAEGGIAVTGGADAELRVVLREAGATWTLDIRDRHGVRVLRRDYGAAGGEQAALRVTAVLIERALAAVPVAPLEPQPSVSASAVSSATVADPRRLGTVRALPAVPISPTAASLIASASALPVGSSTTAAAPRARPPKPEDDRPDGPRLGRLRTVAPAVVARGDEPAERGEVPRREVVPTAPSPGPTATATASATSADPGPATAVATSDLPRPDATAVVPPDAPPDAQADTGSAPRAKDAEASTSPPGGLVQTPEDRSLDEVDPARWRLVASGATRWWGSPGDVPQVGFGLGAERGVGPLVLGGATRLAGLPCCARDTTEVQADVLELAVAGYGLLPLLSTEGRAATLHLAAELEVALLRGEGQRVVTGASPATVADLLGASVALGVGPGFEVALTQALGLRLRVLVRVSVVSYEAGLGPGEDPIHSGWIHPYIDLAIPLGI